MSNQDPNRQVENDQTPVAEYPNESYSEEGETSKNSALSCHKYYQMMKLKKV